MEEVCILTTMQSVQAVEQTAVNVTFKKNLKGWDIKLILSSKSGLRRMCSKVLSFKMRNQMFSVGSTYLNLT